MLFAAPYEGKITFAALLTFAAILGLIVYAPIAIVRELRRPPTEELPEWMGSARKRKVRMAVAFLIIGLVVAGMTAAIILSQ